jgi:N-acetylglutamate synthase-like GNAT family acetyltransferase
MVRAAHLNPMGLKWQRFTLAVSTDGNIVGCIQLKPHRGGVLELASLVVSKEWRRKGIARLLIDHLKQTVGPPIWLMCASPLTRFYKPFGFRQVYLGQPMPAYFRWMLRLTLILNRLSPQSFGLAIMVWENY